MAEGLSLVLEQTGDAKVTVTWTNLGSWYDFLTDRHDCCHEAPKSHV